MHKTLRLPGGHGEVYAGWRRWDHWEVGFGGWLLDGADCWLNLGWLYCGLTVWRDKMEDALYDLLNGQTIWREDDGL